MPTERLKHIVDVRVSTVDKKSQDGHVPVRLCNYTDVYYADRITADMPLMEATATPEQVERFTLCAGDVLITKDSETPEDIAVSAHVPADLPGIVSGYHLAILRPDPRRLDGRYLHWALQAKPIRDQFTLAAIGVTRYGLRHGSIGEVRLPLPSLTSQRAIADLLDAEHRRVDMLASHIERQVERLHERTTSLITAAVTGQLDITGA